MHTGSASDMAELPDPGASLWMATTQDAPSFEPLQGDLEVDLAVIGGGILGITTALLAAREGARVAVLERDVIAGGVTGHTTAKVSALQTTAISELRDKHSPEAARQYAQGNRAAVETVARLIEELGIDCDAQRRPAITFALDPAQRGTVEAEADAAREAGLDAVLAGDAPVPHPTAG